MKWQPVTPGELLLEEFSKPIGISLYRVAKETGVTATRIALPAGSAARYARLSSKD